MISYIYGDSINYTMTFKSILKKLVISSIFIVIFSCGEMKDDGKELIKITETKKISVFNFDNNQQLSEYRKLNLDENHPNLLNPQISRSKLKEVKNSWTDMHQRIGETMAEKQFKWNVEDSMITVVHKFYFNSESEIESYFFNVLNDNVSNEKKEEFAELISDFAISNKIEYKSEGKFAQCGKTKYLNE